MRAEATVLGLSFSVTVGSRSAEVLEGEAGASVQQLQEAQQVAAELRLSAVRDCQG
jgi:hypothetical protein